MLFRSIAKAEESLNGDGRILVRESGTEPVIRVMAEAKTTEICNQVVDAILEVIKSKGHEA